MKRLLLIAVVTALSLPTYTCTSALNPYSESKREAASAQEPVMVSPTIDRAQEREQELKKFNTQKGFLLKSMLASVDLWLAGYDKKETSIDFTKRLEQEISAINERAKELSDRYNNDRSFAPVSEAERANLRHAVAAYLSNFNTIQQFRARQQKIASDVRHSDKPYKQKVDELASRIKKLHDSWPKLAAKLPPELWVVIDAELPTLPVPITSLEIPHGFPASLTTLITTSNPRYAHVLRNLFGWERNTSITIQASGQVPALTENGSILVQRDGLCLFLEKQTDGTYTEHALDTEGVRLYRLSINADGSVFVGVNRNNNHVMVYEKQPDWSCRLIRNIDASQGKIIDDVVVDPHISANGLMLAISWDLRENIQEKLTDIYILHDNADRPIRVDGSAVLNADGSTLLVKNLFYTTKWGAQIMQFGTSLHRYNATQRLGENAFLYDDLALSTNSFILAASHIRDYKTDIYEKQLNGIYKKTSSVGDPNKKYRRVFASSISSDGSIFIISYYGGEGSSIYARLLSGAYKEVYRVPSGIFGVSVSGNGSTLAYIAGDDHLRVYTTMYQESDFNESQLELLFNLYEAVQTTKPGEKITLSTEQNSLFERLPEKAQKLLINRLLDYYHVALMRPRPHATAVYAKSVKAIIAHYGKDQILNFYALPLTHRRTLRNSLTSFFNKIDRILNSSSLTIQQMKDLLKKLVKQAQHDIPVEDLRSINPSIGQYWNSLINDLNRNMRNRVPINLI